MVDIAGNKFKIGIGLAALYVIYFMDSGDDGLKEVDPTAAFTYDVDSAAGVVHLDGSLSSDPGEGGIVSWEWTIHHENTLYDTATGRRPDVNLGPEGTYGVELVVTDGKGNTDSVADSFYWLGSF